MVFTISSLFIDALGVILIGCFLVYANFRFRTKKHWIKRNLPSENPSFLFGNLKEANYRRRLGDVLDDLYFKHKDKGLIGIWIYVKPSILITNKEIMKEILIKNFSHFHDRGLAVHEDLEPLTGRFVNRRLGDVLDDLYFKHKDKGLIGIWIYVKPSILITNKEIMKEILIKNFSHFHDRGLAVHEDLEPLTAHLFNVSGLKWRNLRVTLAPTFTSGKMKNMFATISAVSERLQTFLFDAASKNKTLEMKDVMACFTTDVISSCAFGIESRAMEDPESEFRVQGKKLFKFDFYQTVAAILNFIAPNLQRLLRLRQFPEDSSDFFLKVVKEVVDYREKNNIDRKDFMNLLMQIKKRGQIDDVDGTMHEGLEDGMKTVKSPFTMEQVAAQAFSFFFAGYETSSTTLIWIFYELALHPDYQEKLQKEIDDTLTKTDGLTYEAVQQMQYLEMVLQETLRKYPPLPALFRECTKTFVVPGTDYVIEKGDSIVLPNSAVQSDPEFFPQPKKFDPERFSHENSSSRDPFLNLSFGAGPRICIGARFGILQVKIGIISVLSKYRVEVSERTLIPMKMDPSQFFPSPLGGMYLKLSCR